MKTSSPTRRRIARYALPGGLSAFILITAIGRLSPLVSPDPLRTASGFSLSRPAAYAVLAPLSELFDSLTLLSIPQVIAMLAFVGVVIVCLRAEWIRREAVKKNRAPSALDEIRFLAVAFGAMLALSGLAILLPRPMAALHVNDTDLVTVDFHSHTSASHDGRESFTPDANREWHRKAGFDAAYISDHHTFAGAFEGARFNPPVAGDGTVLLTGIEFLDDDEHLVALGLDKATTNPDPHEWHPLYSASAQIAGTEPAPALLVLALPGDLKKLPADEMHGTARLRAVEISDGSPRGLEQASRDRSALLLLADRMNLALVSGSDNHGWGHAAPAWSVMRIPGWRTMSAPALDAAIRSTIARDGRRAVQVVARRLPSMSSPLALALTAPAIVWTILRSLSWPERFSFLVWTWCGWALVAVPKRRRVLGAVHIPEWLPELVPSASRAEIAATE